jgi:PleD family two-component response regulator
LNQDQYTPLVVLIEGQEWTARSVESVLRPLGCAVFRAYTGQQGLDILRRMIPDLILVDRHLADMTASQVFSSLNDVPTVRSSTPRALISTSPVRREERIAAFEKGAWEILTPPFDPAELTLRFGTWIKAKREVDEAREEGMLDPATGLYNLRGLLRRVNELLSDASRNERYISLLAVGLPADASGVSEGAEAHQISRLVGSALEGVTRLCDAVARVGPSEFIIVAPNTDSLGAEVLAKRLLESAEARDLDLRAGVISSLRERDDAIAPLDFLNEATEALRQAQSAPDGPPVFHKELLN